MKYIIGLIIVTIAVLSACSTKDKYDVARYYDLHEQDSVLTSIVTYIFIAPPYTSMSDRFQQKHRAFYSDANSKFNILKYFIADDGTHYFYVMRIGPTPNEKRGVGGYYKMDKNFRLKGFREVFVTPVLPEADVKERCAFLFEEMINHNIEKYLPMSSYIQWPNKVTYYDTITYEWKSLPGTF